MNKKITKVCFLSLSFILATCNFVYADENDAIGNILNSMLSMLTWAAYAIAIGIIVYIGIKYVMSAADEKARLKGMIPKYLIGIGLIVFCFTIASSLAKIAGNNSAEEIIDVGKEAGEHFPIEIDGTKKAITSDIEEIGGTCPSNGGGNHVVRAGAAHVDEDGRKWYDVSCQNCGQHWAAYLDDTK